MAVVVRKSSRLTERVAQTELDISNQQKDYDLNLVKTIKKKAEQCTREIKVFEEQKGQNRVFQMSGGIYELYRHTLIAYYENLEIDSKSPLKVHIKPIKDKKGVNVETQIRVSCRSGRSSGTPKYTVNLYHTKSNMMVNGREAHLFTGDHKAAVTKILTIQNLDSIDQELRTVLLRELDKIQIQTSSSQVAEPTDTIGHKNRNGNPKSKSCEILPQPCMPVALPSFKPKSSETLPQPHMPVTPPTHSQTLLPLSPTQGPGHADNHFVCLHCNAPSIENAIECSTCGNWYHYTCESMTTEEFDRHCDDLNASYTCLSCMTENITQVNVVEITEGGPDPEPQGIGPSNMDRCHVPGEVVDGDHVLPLVEHADLQAKGNPLEQYPDGASSPEKSSLQADNPLSNTCDSNIQTDQGSRPAGRPKAKKIDKTKPIMDVGNPNEQLRSAHYPNENAGQINCSIDEQMVKSKEKTLNQREKKLKDAEKKLHMREIGLIEQANQNDYSKAYILTMENKLKELENSNRLLKMKMLSQYGLESSTVQHSQDSQRPCASSDLDIKANNTTSEYELQARMAQIELRLLESRIAQLEQNFSSYSYGPYWTPYNYQAYYNPYPSYHNPSTQNYYPWAYAGEHGHYIPNTHEAYYPYYGGTKTTYTYVNGHTAQQDSQGEYLFRTCRRTMSSSGYLTSDSKMATNGIQTQPGPTLPIDVDDIQAIPVHFSCRGRRKTARIKPMHPPSSHARKTNKKKPSASGKSSSVTSSNTVTPAKKTRMSPDSASPQVALPVGKRTKSLATTSTAVTAASIDSAKTKNTHMRLEPDERLSRYPAILTLKGTSPEKAHQMETQNPLVIPRILILDSPENTHEDTPNPRFL